MVVEGRGPVSGHRGWTQNRVEPSASAARARCYEQCDCIVNTMVVTPERRMSACLPSGKGLGLVGPRAPARYSRRDVGVGVQVVDDRRLDVLVRLVALVRLEAVGHEHVVQVVAVPHIDELLGQRVPAAVRAQCMRLVVVAGQSGTES